jgi:putative oxidoreductase
MNKLFATEDSWGCMIVRIFLGFVFLPHGAQKVLGIFGGAGFGGTIQTFTTQMHIPAFLAVLVIIAEFFGALGLIVGCLSRVAAFGILCDMIGAMIVVHWKNGFFMNWAGKHPGEGFEYHLLVIGMSLAIIISGAGRWSVDRAIGKRVA